MSYVSDLDDVIYKFVQAKHEQPFPEDNWTLRDAVRGVQIFGGIGSGKSSGSGRSLALSFLKSGFGGIVLTGKVDEAERWKNYAKELSMEDRLVFFDPTEDYKFNPLQYELERSQDEGGGFADNVVGLFKAIIKMGNRIDGEGNGGSQEPFWMMAMERCLKASIELLQLAKKGKLHFEKENGVDSDKSPSEFDLTIPNIAKVLRDTPIGKGFYNRFNELANSNSFSKNEKLQKWADESFVIYALTWANYYIKEKQKKAEEKGKSKSKKLESNLRNYEVVSSYFLSEISTLAERTRSSIFEHFFALANPFRSGLLADYFSGDTSPEILPEKTFEGKIIVLNFPVKKYLQLGVYAQVIYKKIWQQAVEARHVGKSTRPVFMWVDESQYFINEDDVLFQTTARSAKACTVLISQNISNYYATIGGSNAKPLVDSLLGNLATKIFHNNNDYVTNEWAANTIGKDYKGKVSTSDESTSYTKELEYQFLPKNFSLLRTGGNFHKDEVEAVVITADKKWHSNRNYTISTFKQKSI